MKTEVMKGMKALLWDFGGTLQSCLTINMKTEGMNTKEKGLICFGFQKNKTKPATQSYSFMSSVFM